MGSSCFWLNQLVGAWHNTTSGKDEWWQKAYKALAWMLSCWSQNMQVQQPMLVYAFMVRPGAQEQFSQSHLLCASHPQKQEWMEQDMGTSASTVCNNANLCIDQTQTGTFDSTYQPCYTFKVTCPRCKCRPVLDSIALQKAFWTIILKALTLRILHLVPDCSHRAATSAKIYGRFPSRSDNYKTSCAPRKHLSQVKSCDLALEGGGKRPGLSILLVYVLLWLSTWDLQIFW